MVPPWNPIVVSHLSPNARELLRLCKQERLASRNADCMRLYQKKISVLQFIEQWKNSFSPRSQEKLEHLEHKIHLEAHTAALLFVAKLKLRIRRSTHPTIRCKPSVPVLTVQNHEPGKFRRPVIYRGMIDEFVENPTRKYMNSLRNSKHI